MEFLHYQKLYNCEGKLVPAERAFKNKTMIALLFSASWSPECDKFLLMLKQVYQVLYTHFNLNSNCNIIVLINRKILN